MKVSLISQQEPIYLAASGVKYKNEHCAPMFKGCHRATTTLQSSKISWQWDKLQNDMGFLCLEGKLIGRWCWPMPSDLVSNETRYVLTSFIFLYIYIPRVLLFNFNCIYFEFTPTTFTFFNFISYRQVLSMQQCTYVILKFSSLSFQILINWHYINPAHEQEQVLFHSCPFWTFFFFLFVFVCLSCPQ